MARSRSAHPRVQSPAIGDEHAHERNRGAVHAIERDRALRGLAERRNLAPEEMRFGQRIVRDLVRRRRLDRTARGLERAAERIGPRVEVVGVLVGVNQRQHGPAVGAFRRDANGGFENRPATSAWLLRVDAIGVAESAQRRFVRPSTDRADGRARRRSCSGAARRSCRRPWRRCAARARPADAKIASGRMVRL